MNTKTVVTVFLCTLIVAGGILGTAYSLSQMTTPVAASPEAPALEAQPADQLSPEEIEALISNEVNKALEEKNLNDNGNLEPFVADPAPDTAAAGQNPDCMPTDVTSLPDRPSMTINNTVVTLQVRDNNKCDRPLWQHETGVATGQNYTVDMGEGWAIVVFPTTVAVHREGGSQVDFTNQEIVVVKGPFIGGIGAYEAGVRVVPVEWVDALIAQLKPIQETQAGHPVDVVNFDQ